MSSLLSVLMTAYNREQYIAEAIESVIRSTYNNFELIIVDDSSSDKTVEIARSFAGRDSRIRVFVNEKNRGDYPNRNLAASYARGEFIMYVDSDDKIQYDGFERCIREMHNYPEAGFGMQYKQFANAAFLLSANEAIRKHFFEQALLMIGPGGTILRRAFFQQIGGYPEKYGPANDMYFNLKAASLGSILMLPFEFNYYRIHAGQELNNKFSYLYNNYNYLKDALRELKLPLTADEKNWILNKSRRRFIVNLCSYLVNSGNPSGAIAAIRYANFGLKDVWRGLVHPPL
jgi:glycosyltransferase involved in cell wall biosynthesis